VKPCLKKNKNKNKNKIALHGGSTCDTIHIGDRDQEDHCWGPAQEKSSQSQPIKAELLLSQLHGKHKYGD
jgi:hypothetical protein